MLRQVVGAGFVLCTKDRKVAAVVQPVPAASGNASDDSVISASRVSPILADIRCLYCMADGESGSHCMHRMVLVSIDAGLGHQHIGDADQQ